MIELLNAFLMFCITLTVALVGSWLLPLKNRAVYWALMVAGHFFCLALGSAPNYVQLIPFVVTFCLIPYLCWDAPRSHRLLCALSLLLLELAIEVLGLFILSLAGMSTVDQSVADKEIHAAGRIMGICMYLLMGLGLRKLVHHFTNNPDELGWGTGLYTPFLILQTFMMLCLMPAIISYDSVVELPIAIAAGTALLGSMLITILAVLMLRRQARAALEQQRAASLQTMLDEYVVESQERMKTLEVSAQFRHDLRNHLQVVTGLVARGNHAEARVYVARLRETIAKDAQLAENATVVAKTSSTDAASETNAEVGTSTETNIKASKSTAAMVPTAEATTGATNKAGGTR